MDATSLSRRLAQDCKHSSFLLDSDVESMTDLEISMAMEEATKNANSGPDAMHLDDDQSSGWLHNIQRPNMDIFPVRLAEPIVLGNQKKAKRTPKLKKSAVQPFATWKVDEMDGKDAIMGMCNLM